MGCTGIPLQIGDSVATRLLDKVALDRASGCWTWSAAIGNTGYGIINVDGVSRLAHRVSYLYFRGPIAGDKNCDHLCRNRKCVNPWHIEIVTPAENIRRASKKMDRCKRGHDLSGDNLGTTAYGRFCVTCRKDRWATWGPANRSAKSDYDRAYRTKNRERIREQKRVAYARLREAEATR